MTAAVEGALRSAADGSGRLVLIVGDAGAGKTWLAQQARDAAAAAGMATSWLVGGRPGAPAFWPWSQLLTALPGHAIARHPLGAGLAEPTAEPPARFAVFDDVAALLADAGRERPLLIVLDDLHEADASSLSLLAHVVVLLRGMPVVVIATVRTDFTPDRDEWSAVWPGLLRHGDTVRVGPMTADEIETVVAAELGRPPAPGVVDRIAARTGGNALFVRELARLMPTTPDEVDRLPTTVRAVIAARVEECSGFCRRVLEAAAVIGIEFPLDVLVDTLGAADVGDAVGEAVRRGLLRGVGPGRFRFVHEIVRDAVHDLLAAEQRRDLHRAVADRAAGQGRAADASFHYRSAGPRFRTEAARWSERAGRDSLATLAYEDAAAHFTEALDGAAQPGRVQVLLGTALLSAGKADAARTAYLKAADLARADGDGQLLADAALGLGAGLGGFEVTLNDAEQIAALEDALHLIGEDSPAVRAALLARLSIALTYEADSERRAALAGTAVDLAQASGDDATIAAALAAYCDVIAGPEQCSRRLALSADVVEIAQRLRDRPLELLGRRHRLVARYELGDMGGVEDELRGYEHTARALHQPLYSWLIPLWRAAIAFGQGRIADCRELLAVAENEGTAAGSVNAQALVPTMRWFLAAELADVDDLRALAVSYWLDDGLGPWVPISKALFVAQVGDLDIARHRLDSAPALLEALPRDSEWLPTVTQAAEAVALVGGHPIADWIYDALLPFEELHVVEGIGAVARGSVARHLGLLAGVRGDRRAAAKHFDHALEANRRLGATLIEARTLFDAAVTLEDDALRKRAKRRYAAIGATHRVALLGGAVQSGVAGFRRSGETWTLDFAERTASVRDAKGMRDIAVLLAQPGRPVPAVELARTPDAAGVRPEGDLGDVIDATARTAYRARLQQLEVEADGADRTGDAERAARIAEERAALLIQLSAAYGLGGRVRRTGSAPERARTTVTARIRDSIRRIEAVHPDLGRHLRAAIRTGTVCSYEPERPVSWQLTS